MFSDEEIKSLSAEDMVQRLLEEEQSVPVFPLERVPFEGYFSSFDEVKTSIQIDLKNQVFQFPVFDERQDEFYQKSIFIKKKDRIPMKGYFRILGVRAKQKLFGVVEVTVYGLQATRRDSDHQFEGTGKLFKKDEQYIFLHEAEKKSFKQVTLDNKNHPDYLEWQDRIQLQQHVFARLENVQKTYFKAFDDYYVRSGGYGTRKGQIRSYFEVHKAFLERYLEQGIALRRLYASISKDEYEQLKKYKNILMGKIESGFSILDGIQGGDDEDLNVDRYRGNKYEQLIGIAKTLQAFRTPRMEPTAEKEFDALYPLQGYIACEAGMLYPNIAQVEKREYYSENSVSELKEYDIEQKIIQMQQGK